MFTRVGIRGLKAGRTGRVCSVLPGLMRMRMLHSAGPLLAREKYEFDEETVAKLKQQKQPESLLGPEGVKNEPLFDLEGDKLGLAAMPAPFAKIMKLMVFGVSLLLTIKLFVNDKKNKRYNKDRDSDAVEDNVARIKPGFPEGPSSVQRKSEYEGAGSSYMSRKSGDKLF